MSRASRSELFLQKNYSFMEFNIQDLNKIIENAFNQSPSTDISVSSTENQQPLQTVSQAPDNRQYCLIVFNNPKWSQLRQKSAHVFHFIIIITNTYIYQMIITLG